MSESLSRLRDNSCAIDRRTACPIQPFAPFTCQRILPSVPTTTNSRNGCPVLILLRAPVPFWGQTTWSLTGSSPKRKCSPKTSIWVSKLTFFFFLSTLIELCCLEFDPTFFELCFLTQFSYCSCRSEPTFLFGMLNPFITAVPFWGQTTRNFTGLSPKTGLRF